jgi:hypothetical protein
MPAIGTKIFLLSCRLITGHGQKLIIKVRHG